MTHLSSHHRKALWPFYVLDRDNTGLSHDLRIIIDHFEHIAYHPDVVVFIPNAGLHLCPLFREVFSHTYAVGMITLRRPSSARSPGLIRRWVIRRRVTANICRHLEVVLRAAKLQIGMGLKRQLHGYLDVDVSGRRVLLIDDSVDTGTTMRMAIEYVISRGASDVRTACIANQLMYRRFQVDFAVHQYALLRSPTSPDFHAK